MNEDDVLTLEEIEASTDLTGKVSGAEAVKDIATLLSHFNHIYMASSDGNSSVKFTNVYAPYRRIALLIGNGNGAAFLSAVALNSYGGLTDFMESQGRPVNVEVVDRDRGIVNLTISSVNPWGYYFLIALE